MFSGFLAILILRAIKISCLIPGKKADAVAPAKK
jgi:hypothetical protein